jgi:hypothetical protein
MLIVLDIYNTIALDVKFNIISCLHIKAYSMAVLYTILSVYYLCF